MNRSISVLLLIAFLPLVLFASGFTDDGKDLKAKDPLVRLAAVKRIAEQGGDGASKALMRALKDKDWEVVMEAARGLGRWGQPGNLSALTKLSWDGPAVPVREAAARSAGLLDMEKALNGLEKKMSGDRGLRVAEAYVWVLDAAKKVAPVEAPRALVKLLKSKDTLTRAAAARALVLTSSSERIERLTSLLDSEFTAVVAAALEAAAASPRLEQVEILVKLLERRVLSDVIERRALAALVANVGEDQGPTALCHSLIARLAKSDQPAVAERAARFCERASGESWFDSKSVAASLQAALGAAAAGPRAAAARGLRFAPPKEATITLRKLAEEDASARVRRAAVASALSLTEITDPDQLAWVTQRLGDERDSLVREDLAVALGVEGLDGAGSALIQALGDTDWAVAVCAAVSLGRTRTAAAVAPLVALTKDELDWRLRGAGAVGLCHVMRPEAIAPLIELLADPEPLVIRTVYGFLKTIDTRVPQSMDPETWRTWWAENEKRVKLVTPKEAAERRERYGYTVSPAELYAGLDVMVFKSDGDHIETVFDFIGIQYRSSSSNRVPEDALDAAGVFVSNCTGTMQSSDVERLQWFTKSGGYLFGSCWALNETIVRVAPGTLRKLETPGEVLDQVTASACNLGSPYLKGVFGKGVVPIYHLVGAFLIEVLERERVEVLVDSPECAERWGGGNLAAWFRTGHGRILNSVNHFDAQGLTEATNLKTPEDRMAYAVDHMGVSLAKIRETKKEKWWSGNAKAAQEIRDLSVFTLITNFVRARRIESY